MAETLIAVSRRSDENRIYTCNLPSAMLLLLHLLSTHDLSAQTLHAEMVCCHGCQGCAQKTQHCQCMPTSFVFCTCPSKPAVLSCCTIECSSQPRAEVDLQLNEMDQIGRLRPGTHGHSKAPTQITFSPVKHAEAAGSLPLYAKFWPCARSWMPAETHWMREH